MQIANDKVVYFHYTLTDQTGEVLDSSTGDEPLAYIHGQGNIIPGLERALLGQTVGASLKVVVEPKDGYGEHDSNLVQSAPRSAFRGVDDIQPGMEFQTQGGDGPMRVKVLEVSDDEILLDGNHPMAGMTLHFDVEITEVRDATPEEMDHGHVHGPGGHHH